MNETSREKQNKKEKDIFSTRGVFSTEKSSAEAYGHLTVQKKIEKSLKEKDPRKREEKISRIIEGHKHMILTDFDQTFVPKDVAFRLMWDAIPDTGSRLSHLVEFVRKGWSGVKEWRGRGWRFGASGDVKVIMRAAFEGQRKEEVLSTFEQVAQKLTINPNAIEFLDAYKKYTGVREVNVFILTRNASLLVQKLIDHYAKDLSEEGVIVHGVIGNTLEFNGKDVFERVQEVAVTTKSKRNMIPPGEIYLVDKQEAESLKDLNVFNLQSKDQNYPEIMRIMTEKRTKMKVEYSFGEKLKAITEQERELQLVERELEFLFQHPPVTLSVEAARQKAKLLEEFLLKRSSINARKTSISSQRRELQHSLEQLNVSLKGAYHELPEDIAHKILRYIRRRFE